MARRDIQRELQELYQVRQMSVPERTATLRKALRDRINVIVARAALLAGETSQTELIPDLATAFERLFRDPVKSDAQCMGKNALAKVLKELGHADGATFLPGVDYVQMEPIWGGSTDTAGVLRGTCALALAQCRDLPRDQVLRYLVDACTDPITTVRSDAVRGLLQMGGDDGVLLLRLKARAGDEDPQITGQAIEAVLQIDEEAAVPWAARFLNAAEPVSDEAALALGASRLPAAVTVLIERWEKAKSPSPALLRGIGISRLDAAATFLLGVLRKARARDARLALECLAPFAGSTEFGQKIADTVRMRDDVFAEAEPSSSPG